ncbi:hypothetical protein GW796_09235 [archaeon]|nr:hypothetical protein [archaeon]NCT58911.1 hypothetical protein [archaeon]PJB16996.1 MAG: hypothetical protein CO117_13290 [Flavobacteriaceae bacterium CG_4_9_14_3_um_filter_33_16]
MEKYNFSSISGCCDPWDDRNNAIGLCPDCGEPVDNEGNAVVGCHYSPEVCSTCGSCPCDMYC